MTTTAFTTIRAEPAGYTTTRPVTDPVTRPATHHANSTALTASLARRDDRGCCCRVIDWIIDVCTSILACLIKPIIAIFEGALDVIETIFCCRRSQSTARRNNTQYSPDDIYSTAAGLFTTAITARTSSYTPYTPPAPPPDELNPLPARPETVDPLLNGMTKGPNVLEVAIQIPWDRANDPLFNETYARALCNRENHLDWTLGGGGRDTTTIRTFFNALINGENTRGLSAENRNRLKLTVCAIINTLQGLRALDEHRPENERQFPTMWRNTLNRIRDALGHCSNNINPSHESILIDVMAASRGGALGDRVKAVIQKIRTDCLQGAVRNTIERVRNDERRSYYEAHEAASTNYYFRRCYQRAGLPVPASAFDEHYESFAMQNQDDAVMEEFNRLFSLNRILETLYPAIGNPHDRSIPKQMFTDWCRRTNRVTDDAFLCDPQTRRPITDAQGRQIPLNDSNGYFQKRLIVDYLLELGILRRQ